MIDYDAYRPCVGMMILNAQGLVFVGERSDSPGAWQMPQGGIDAGEDVDTAGRRECREEIGVDTIEIIARIDHWLLYDLPEELQRQLWKGKYRGQRQKWLLARFTGRDEDIALDRYGPPEFMAWQWVRHDQLLDLIVPFKRDTYREVLRAFAAYLPK